MSPLSSIYRRAVCRWPAAVAGILLANFAGDTLAHASLVRSEPSRRATLASAPSELRLWFNEPIEPAYADVAVFDQQGTAVVSGKGSVTRDDPKRVTLNLPALAPGKYTVKYKVLSVDGHVVDWSYAFTIAAPSGAR